MPGANVYVGVNGQGDLIGGFGVSGSLGYGPYSANVGYNWTLGADQSVHPGGWDVGASAYRSLLGDGKNGWPLDPDNYPKGFHFSTPLLGYNSKDEWTVPALGLTHLGKPEPGKSQYAANLATSVRPSGVFGDEQPPRAGGGGLLGFIFGEEKKL